MDIYKERIRTLFEKSGKTDADLEREIGIPAKKISQWNIGYTKSYTKYIPQIASYFHVSTDYLLGNTDDPSPSGQKQKPTPEGEPVALHTAEDWKQALSGLSQDELKQVVAMAMEQFMEGEGKNGA